MSKLKIGVMSFTCYVIGAWLIFVEEINDIGIAVPPY